MARSLKVKKIIKRDGRIANFDPDKIANAIFKAALALGGEDRSIAENLADQVVAIVEKKFGGKKIPTVEDIQDIVETVLIEGGHAKTAKAYILYRQKRKELREAKALLGVYDDLKLSLNAVKVLAARYLRKDENRKIIETPGQMFRRVAKAIAKVDRKYDKRADVKKVQEEFYEMMAKLEFLPNSPTLMNAGTEIGQLSACFVLGVEDSMESIFEAVKNSAIVHKCLVGDTKVMTKNGLLPLEEIENEKTLILSDDGEHPVEEFHSNGSKEITMIETDHGYFIEGTLKHKVKIVNDEGEIVWKEFKDICEGDWAVLRIGGWNTRKKRELPEFTFKERSDPSKGQFRARIYELPSQMTPEFAELIGIYLADGSNHNDGVRFVSGTTSLELANYTSSLVRSVFGVKPSITRNNSGSIEVGLYSVQVKEYLDFFQFLLLVMN